MEFSVRMECCDVVGLFLLAYMLVIYMPPATPTPMPISVQWCYSVLIVLYRPCHGSVFCTFVGN